MTGEKSEAQLKNEEEVRRILKERGYSSASSKKQVAKSLGKSFPIMPFIYGFIIIGLAVGGWLFLKNNPFETKTNNNSSSTNNVATETNQDLIDFRTCLGLVDTSEISMEDADFWNKYITRYEQIISCYDQYPSVSDSTEKADLQDTIAKLRENSAKSEIGSTEYESIMSQINIDLTENLNKTKTEDDDWDQELLRRKQEREEKRAELDAQYAKEQADREAKQARCNEFKAEYPDIDTYKEKKGNLSALRDAYETAKDEYNHAMSIWGSAVSAGREKGAEAAEKNANEKQAAMNAAYNTWRSADTSLGNAYNADYSRACL